MGCSKSSSKREFIAIQSYKKQEKHQIDNLTLHLKQLEKEEIASHTIITGDLTRHLHQQTAHQNRKLIMKQVFNDIIR